MCVLSGGVYSSEFLWSVWLQAQWHVLPPPEVHLSWRQRGKQEVRGRVQPSDAGCGKAMCLLARERRLRGTGPTGGGQEGGYPETSGTWAELEVPLKSREGVTGVPTGGEAWTKLWSRTGPVDRGRPGVLRGCSQGARAGAARGEHCPTGKAGHQRLCAPVSANVVLRPVGAQTLGVLNETGCREWNTRSTVFWRQEGLGNSLHVG